MRTKVLHIGFDNITMNEAVTRAMSYMTERRGRRPAYVVTPNPEIVMASIDDTELRETLERADMALPDGIGIIHGAKLLGTPMKQKIPGIDFTMLLMGKMAERGMSVYLYGSAPGVADRASQNLLSQYPGLKIAGCHDGYGGGSEVIADINRAKPDFLFVCLGSPKQEHWIRANAHKLDTGLIAALGGCLDVISGEVRRAPDSFQKLGLEWLYRLMKQPSRILRMRVLPIFLMKILIERGNKNKQITS